MTKGQKFAPSVALKGRQFVWIKEQLMTAREGGIKKKGGNRIIIPKEDFQRPQY